MLILYLGTLGIIFIIEVIHIIILDIPSIQSLKYKYDILPSPSYGNNTVTSLSYLVALARPSRIMLCNVDGVEL